MKALTAIQITMTSLELVEFINADRRARAEAVGAAFPSPGFAKLEHADFLKKVPEVLGNEHAGNFSCMFDVSIGNGAVRKSPGYRFPKREACLMAMSYSYELQAKVFDRMTELEAQQAPKVPDLSTDVGKLLLIQDLTAKQLALIESNKQLEAERDEAKRTKAEIGSRREATAMATAAAKSKEVERLKHELGRNQQHATVVAVEKATGRKFAKNAYVALRRVTKKYGLEAVSVMDPRWGTTKAWPAIAWREAFGIDLPDLFPGAEAA